MNEISKILQEDRRFQAIRETDDRRVVTAVLEFEGYSVNEFESVSHVDPARKPHYPHIDPIAVGQNEDGFYLFWRDPDTGNERARVKTSWKPE